MTPIHIAARHRLVPAFGAAEADSLLPHLQAMDLADGEAILQDGRPSPWLYLLVDGALRVVVEGHQGRVVLGDRVPGDWVGEVGLVDGGPATATVLSVGPSRVLRIDRATLERLSEDEPHVAAVLLRHVTRQLAERIWAGSSGVVQKLGDQVTVRRVDEVRGWVSQVLSWLLGGERTA